MMRPRTGDVGNVPSRWLINIYVTWRCLGKITALAAILLNVLKTNRNGLILE